MTEWYCGVDFGTTNSSAAIFNGEQVRVLSLDSMNDNATSLPSLLYITREGESIVGRAAALAFIERNVDREILLREVDLGVDIEGYIGAEPDKSEAYNPALVDHEVTEAVRARATMEVNSPGRLFQSLKTLLRHRGFQGTDVFGQHYQIEELVSILLKRIKAGVDEAAGRPINKAVFGRPVQFSEWEDENAVAEQRLQRAARLAGFEEVTFFYEPVGACVEYAMQSNGSQRLMVVDIGGGTCDVCIMEFGGQGDVKKRLGDSKICSVAGVPVAGDAIDREITRIKLFPIFGSRCRYGPAQLRMPQYIYNQILDWQNLYKLNTEETIHWLLAAEVSSDDPPGLRALRCLIQRNYGYPIAREVEAAKKRLSFENETHIEFDREDIAIHELLERTEFAHIIEDNLEKMRGSILEAEKRAGVTPQDIDLVLTTGGTSLIPAIRNMLSDRYGEAHMHRRDTFTSVASGLSIVAQYT